MAPPKILGICIVPGCNKAATGREFCNPHYQVWYRCGQPIRPVLPEIDKIKARFMRKIRKDKKTGCWLWTGSKNSHGYGVIMIAKKHRAAHRISWWLKNSAMPPDGLFLCHKCDVRNCVNPAHLFVGTAKENFDDMRAKRRHAFGEKSGNAKLTPRQVLSIRKDPRNVSVIAKDFDVSAVLIGRIKRRQSWGHIPGKIVPAKRFKLTESQIAEIRSAIGKQSDIGDKYGITQPMVSQIKLGKAHAR